MNSERILYFIAFIFLGISISTVVHGVIEIVVINLLVKDFERYSLGLFWGQWFLVHHVGAVILLIAGVLFGLWQGQYWWNVVYVKKKFGKR